MDPALTQIRQMWARLETSKRRIVVAVTLLSFGGLLALGVLATRDDYVVVVRSSDPGVLEDARAELDKEGIQYIVDESGSGLLAKREDLGKARVATAAAGSPVGFESLGDLQLGATPQRERWAYQRALEGELERTISALDEVVGSRVHLVLPERSPFLGDAAKGSASVSIRLDAGRSLSSDRIRGIAALVAGAVDGIEPEDVVLVDDKGRLLSDAKRADDMATMGTLLELREAIEARTAAAIAQAVLPILGSAQALSVAVTADLDSSAIERTTNSVDPQTQATISEQTKEDDQRGGGSIAAPTGTAANLATTTSVVAASATPTGEERKSTHMTSNYDYTRTQEKEVRGAGRLNRLSVGVTIDQAALAAAVGTGDVKELEARIQSTVRAAMGFDAKRGDALEVSFVPFQKSAVAVDETISTPFDWSRIERLAPQALFALGIVLFFAFVVRPLIANISMATKVPATRELEDEPSSKDALAKKLRHMVEQYEHVEAGDLDKLVELEGPASAEVVRRWIRAA